MKKVNVQIFGGTQKYFGGTSGFRGTQVEKHWSRQSKETEEALTEGKCIGQQGLYCLSSGDTYC